MKLILILFSMKSIQIGLSFIGWSALNARRCQLKKEELEEKNVSFESKNDICPESNSLESKCRL